MAAHGGGAVRQVRGRAVRAGGASVSAPLRLTRRGRVLVRSVLGGVVVAGAGAMLLLGGGVAAAGQGAQPVRVQEHVVAPGETLWVIAGEVAPDGDRREMIERIIDLNGLSSAGLQAGQVLSLPVSA